MLGIAARAHIAHIEIAFHPRRIQRIHKSPEFKGPGEKLRPHILQRHHDAVPLRHGDQPLDRILRQFPRARRRHHGPRRIPRHIHRPRQHQDRVRAQGLRRRDIRLGKGNGRLPLDIIFRRKGLRPIVARTQRGNLDPDLFQRRANRRQRLRRGLRHQFALAVAKFNGFIAHLMGEPRRIYHRHRAVESAQSPVTDAFLHGLPSKLCPANSTFYALDLKTTKLIAGTTETAGTTEHQTTSALETQAIKDRPRVPPQSSNARLGALSGADSCDGRAPRVGLVILEALTFDCREFTSRI